MSQIINWAWLRRDDSVKFIFHLLNFIIYISHKLLMVEIVLINNINHF